MQNQTPAPIGNAATLLLIAIAATTSARAETGNEIVATALPATYSIASVLTEGTAITVRLVPEGGRRMNQLPSLFERQPERMTEALEGIDAVVTIGKLWSDDPLYTAARSANIRVVDIDATKPFSLSLEGIAVASAPVSNARWAADETSSTERVPSPYFWLSPANGARAAEIVARDLARLVPAAATQIEQNLGAFRNEMVDLQTEYQLEFAELPDLTVAALASEFVYLTNAFGIYVDSYFLKQDIDWTDEDLTALTRYLEDNDIGVVIHKWEPDERIAAAIAAAGGRLTVLDPIDLGIEEDDGIARDSYQRLLRADLESLRAALAASNR